MPRGTSRTAEAVCAFRALESRRSRPRLRDPFAARFLPPWARAAVALTPDRALGPLARSSRGLYDDVIERHVAIDARIAAARARTLLILGAGYDTRAWRLRELGLAVVEADFPATLDRKLACIQAHPGAFPTWAVERVPVDFRQPDWPRALPRLEAPVVVVWEGVSMYLERPEVQRSLRLSRDLIGESGRLLMDVWTGPRGLDTRVGSGLLAAIGEPLRFGITPAEIAPFFAASGLEVTETRAPGGVDRVDGRRGGHLTVVESRASA